MLDQTPDDARLGLVVFGTHDDSCTDIETLHPVDRVDRAALAKQVDALEAIGSTPIGAALEHGAKELNGVEGPRAMVLVSDGEPNCEPPPACEVARDIAAQGIDLAVHTIGFKIGDNPKAQETLRCIAEATGGTYSEASDAGTLAETLEIEATRAMEGYQADGVRVEGGRSVQEAEGVVAGTYLTSMTAGEEVDETPGVDRFENTRFFTVPLHEGWRTTLSATLVPPAMESGSETEGNRHLTIFAPGVEGDFCTGKVDRNFQSGYLDVGALTVGLEIEPEDIHERCLTPEGDLVVGVGRYGEMWAGQALDVELAVGYRRADESAFGQAAEPGKVPTMAEVEPDELAGGTSFGTATELRPGQAVTDNVRGSEARYFKVPVELGQNLQVRAAFAGSEQTTAVSVVAYNRLREPLTFEPSDSTVPSGRLGEVYSDVSASKGGVTMQAALAWPILPGNVAGDPAQRPHSVGGDQYLVVSRAWHDGADKPVKFTLQAGVWGDGVQPEGVGSISTAEEYDAEFGVSEPSPSTSPSPSLTASPEVPAESSSPTPSAAPQRTVVAEDSSNGWVVPALAGAGVLCLAGGGAWWWLRRR